jgi:hypothetical protein
LGEGCLDANVRPSPVVRYFISGTAVSNGFSTAAFRLGHSMFADDVDIFSNDGEETQDAMELAEVLFNPSVVEGS